MRIGKKRFIKNVLKIGGLALAGALAGAVAFGAGRAGYVHVTNPEQFQRELMIYKNKFGGREQRFTQRDVIKAAEAIELDQLNMELKKETGAPKPWTGGYPAPTLTDKAPVEVPAWTASEPEPDRQEPSVGRRPVPHRVKGRPSNPPFHVSGQKLPDGFTYNAAGKRVRQLDGVGIALSAAEKLLRAKKAAILNHATHLIHKHVAPHIKMPRGTAKTGGPLLVRHFKRQVRNLPEDVKGEAEIIGHGILLGGALGKRGRKRLSTLAKLAAVAGTLGALYLGRNHIQRGTMNALESVNPQIRQDVEQGAARMFGQLRNGVDDARHAIVQKIRPDRTVSQRAANAVSDVVHSGNKAAREAEHTLSDLLTDVFETTTM